MHYRCANAANASAKVQKKNDIHKKKNNFFMKNSIFYIVYAFFALFFCGCQPQHTPRYIIGVSQCLNDAWRQKMNREMEYELVFHPEVQLQYRYADGNSYLQCQQIDSFISEGIDLLIVSPNGAAASGDAGAAALR